MIYFNECTFLLSLSVKLTLRGKDTQHFCNVAICDIVKDSFVCACSRPYYFCVRRCTLFLFYLCMYLMIKPCFFSCFLTSFYLMYMYINAQVLHNHVLLFLINLNCVLDPLAYYGLFLFPFQRQEDSRLLGFREKLQKKKTNSQLNSHLNFFGGGTHTKKLTRQFAMYQGYFVRLFI